MVEEHLGYNTGFYNQTTDDDVIDWGAVNAQHEESQRQRHVFEFGGLFEWLVSSVSYRYLLDVRAN